MRCKPTKKALKKKCEYLWSLAVRQRDNWTCQFCGVDFRSTIWPCSLKDDGCQGRMEFDAYRQMWKCDTCGRTAGFVGLDAHHIAGRALSVKFLLDNGISLCTKCHKHYAEDWGTTEKRREFDAWLVVRYGKKLDELEAAAKKPAKPAQKVFEAVFQGLLFAQDKIIGEKL